MNVASILASSAQRSPEAVAVRHGTSTLTYAELKRDADGVTSATAELGLGPGDRVLLVGPTAPPWLGAYYGLLSAGMVIVPVNPLAAQAEIEYFLSDSSAALALGFGDAAERMRRAAAALDCPYRSMEPGAGFAAPVHDATARRSHPHALDDAAVLLYTSGTSGRPKGAILTHGNLLVAAEIFAGEFRLSPEDGVLVCLPVSHVFGQACILNPAIKAGASVTLQPRFDAAKVIDLIAANNITVFAGVPTMYNAILRTPTSAGRGLGAALRLAISGGAPNPVEILRQFEARFHCPIVEGWGMTESTGAGTFNRLTRPRKPGRVGVALPGLSVRVVDEAGNDVPPGETGEILLSGPTVMKGYWGRPDATEEVLSGGWLRTGDLGTSDAAATSRSSAARRT